MRWSELELSIVILCAQDSNFHHTALYTPLYSMCQPRRIEFRSPRRLLWGTPHDSYEPVCACGPLPQHWAETPIHNRRPRRCGSDPEPVSFHHASPCESRGGKAGVSLTVSAPGDLLASRHRLGMLRTTSAAVLWRGAEAAGVATPWSRPRIAMTMEET